MKNLPSKEELESKLSELSRAFPGDNVSIEITAFKRKDSDEVKCSYLAFVPSVGISVDCTSLQEAVQLIKWKGGIK